MKIANIIAYVLVILGAVNWGLFGIFNFNLVSMIFGGARAVGSIVVYSLIALAKLTNQHYKSTQKTGRKLFF